MVGTLGGGSNAASDLPLDLKGCFDSQEAQMRSLISIVLGLLFFTQISLAGTPDEDPVVRQRRERFRHARAPTLEDLKLGKTWQCIAYCSEPGKFDILGPVAAYRFLEFDGVITNDDSNIRQSHKFQLEPAALIDYVQTWFPDIIVETEVFIRVSDNGDLIYESTFQYVIPELQRSPKSIADGARFVAHYGVCPANKIKD
jgi:hypothetical protein